MSCVILLLLIMLLTIDLCVIDKLYFANCCNRTRLYMLLTIIFYVYVYIYTIPCYVCRVRYADLKSDQFYGKKSHARHKGNEAKTIFNHERYPIFS